MNANHIAYTLIHETSPKIAVEIARKKCFQGGSIQADAGLNCYIKGRNDFSQYYPNPASNKGAIIELEWSGPISTDGGNTNPDTNVLYDEHPFRAFIRAGTTKHLKLLSITLKPGYDYSTVAVIPSRPFWISLFNIEKWKCSLNLDAQHIQNEILEILKAKPNIEIIHHPYAAYRQL